MCLVLNKIPVTFAWSNILGQSISFTEFLEYKLLDRGFKESDNEKSEYLIGNPWKAHRAMQQNPIIGTIWFQAVKRENQYQSKIPSNIG